MHCWKDITIIFYKYCLCCLKRDDDPKTGNNFSGILRDHDEDALFKSIDEKTIIIHKNDVVYS